MEPVTLRLKALRASAVPPVTVRGLADALGMPSSTYAAYEDPKKYKKPILPFDLTKKIADILGERGVPLSDTMRLAGLQSADLISITLPQQTIKLPVTCAVAAGLWREHVEWPPEERHDMEVGPPPFAGAERFAVHMEGYSMDKIIPPNSDLECLRVTFGAVEPVPGDLVIVERHAHDLTEMTCKRLAKDGDEWVLRAESTKAEFQEEIRLGKPSEAIFVDNEIRVIGIVLNAKQRHAAPTRFSV